MYQSTIEDFYQRWFFNLESLLKGYTHDLHNRPNPHRQLFSQFQEIIGKFLKGKFTENEKIIILSGLRGVGKTTLFAQLFNEESRAVEKVFLDVGKLHLAGISLNDFFDYFEDMKEFTFETLKKKTIIFLDEVQYDKKWGLFLKTIFDRTKAHANLLVLVTGSSALKLKLNPDLARRSTSVEMFPLKFSEYLFLKKKLLIPQKAEETVWRAIFQAKNFKKSFVDLLKIEKEVNHFFLKIAPSETDNFFQTGGFPFNLGIENKTKANELTKSVIDNIIQKDILPQVQLESQSFGKLGDLIYLLGASDTAPYENLCSSLKLNYRTARLMTESLVKSGLIFELKAFGQAYSQVRKASKFLFLSPSLRSATIAGDYPVGLEGKKLEDYFSLIFNSTVKPHFKTAKLFYDAGRGGADFVLKFQSGETTVFETGFGKEDVSQVKQTMEKTKAKLGVVIGSGKLEFVAGGILKIPLKIWLMV